jgi:dihydroorotase
VREASELDAQGVPRLAATITAHHLLHNRNAVFQGGMRPHYYCLPVLKRETHRQALLDAATSGDPRFFLGTDSAPHARNTKETACGCAGCFTAANALELYCAAFERRGALHRLDDFASRFGAAFYGLPRNAGTVTLERSAWNVPAVLPYADADIVPLHAGEVMEWRVLPSG